MNNGIWSYVFSFEKLITIKITKFIYFFGLAGIAIMGIIGVFKGFSLMSYSAATGLGSVFLALVATAGGFVLWRVICEVYIVFFGLYDRVGDIRDAVLNKHISPEEPGRS